MQKLKDNWPTMIAIAFLLITPTVFGALDKTSAMSSSIIVATIALIFLNFEEILRLKSGFIDIETRDKIDAIYEKQIGHKVEAVAAA